MNAPLAADSDLSNTIFLVVEDKPHFREIAHSALVRCRAREAYAPDVEEAIQVLKRLGPQIGGVICDWTLHPTGGLELLRRIRSGKLTRCMRDLCVMILTGKPDAAAVKAAMSLDVNGFAVAPLSVEKLAKTLTQAAQRRITLKDAESYAAIEVPVAERASDGIPLRRAGGAGGEAASAKQGDLVNVRMCTLAQLSVTAGVVLARDLSDGDGHLLLKAGAPLSKALLERLNDVSKGHANSYHLWVGERRAS